MWSSGVSAEFIPEIPRGSSLEFLLRLSSVIRIAISPVPIFFSCDTSRFFFSSRFLQGFFSKDFARSSSRKLKRMPGGIIFSNFYFFKTPHAYIFPESLFGIRIF